MVRVSPSFASFLVKWGGATTTVIAATNGSHPQESCVWCPSTSAMLAEAPCHAEFGSAKIHRDLSGLANHGNRTRATMKAARAW